MHNTPSTRSGVLLCSVSMLALAAGPVYANPQGAVVAAGKAAIHAQGSKLNIHQQSERAVIDWRSFNIAPHEHTQFYHPSSQSVTLNRVHSADPSRIMGRLSANGNLILVNPNGIFFGANSRVDVNGILATTADMDNDAFMRGDKWEFHTPGNPDAAIINEGTISAKEAGLVGLVAPHVENHGLIQARLGKIHLASGDKLTLDLYGDGLLEVAVSDNLKQQLLKNSGSVLAEGGTIAITAAAARELVDSLVQVAGNVKATTIAQQDGRIIIGGGNQSATEVAATVDASGTDAGESGGIVEITGRTVTLEKGTTITADGRTGGGTVRVGGDYQGKGTTPRAEHTVMESGARIIANATQAGDGGKVILWADDSTRFAGTIEAKGAGHGNGGFVETSGKRILTVRDSGRVKTTGQNGKAGLWLLDPQDFTVGSGGDMSVSTLETNLAGGDVAILSSGGGTAGNGDIIIADNVSWSANRLTLTATRDVQVNAVMTASGTAGLTVNTATANGADGSVAGGTLRMDMDASGFNGRIDYSASDSLIINGNTYTILNSLGAEGSTTATDLQGVDGDLAGYYALGSDIDASATAGWDSGSGFSPLGSFTGTLHGLGHTISNLTIDRSATDNVGLFSETAGGSNIHSLGLENIDITGQNYTGGLVGQNGSSSVSEVYATGNVSGSSTTGGLIGYNNGTMDNVWASGDVSGVGVSWSDGTGGLMGSNTATVTNAYATGDVSGTGQMGGLVAYNSGTLTNVYATGTVTSSSGQIIGGLVGRNRGDLTNTYATGNVTGTSNYVGGLVGYQENTGGSITQSYATGDVIAGGRYSGGIAGINYRTISHSYATGNVSGGDYWSGGLVGYNQAGATIIKSYSTGTATNPKIRGGLVAVNNGTITDSFWDTDTSGLASSAGGTGKTTAQMQDLSTFTAAGWDASETVNTTWSMHDGSSYPLLQAVEISFIGKTYDGTAWESIPDEVIVTGGYFAGSANSFMPVTLSGTLSVTGTAVGAVDAGTYSVESASGYTSDSHTVFYSTGDVTVTPRILTASLSANNKIYDGTTAATGTFGDDRVGGDDITLTATAMTFADKNAGTGKTVIATGLSIGGADAGNYTLASTSDTDTADITPRTLTVSLSADDKTYDGTTAAIGTFGDDRVGGDTLTISSTDISFADKNAGTGKTVTVSGLSIGGADAGNYTLASTSDTDTADITPRTLTLTLSGDDKTYDATTAATGTFGDNRLGGDDVTVTASSMTFDSKDAGAGKTVTATGLSLGGADGGNYTVGAASVTDSTVTINKATLTASLVDATPGKYMGTANPAFAVTLSGFKLTDSETDIDVLPTASTVADSNSPVGDYDITIGGGSDNNYTFASASPAGTLTVNPQPSGRSTSTAGPIPFPTEAPAVPAPEPQTPAVPETPLPQAPSPEIPTASPAPSMVVPNTVQITSQLPARVSAAAAPASSVGATSETGVTLLAAEEPTTGEQASSEEEEATFAEENANTGPADDSLVTVHPLLGRFLRLTSQKLF